MTLLIFWIVCVVLYALPSMIALLRKVTNPYRVILVNYFFGWTVIGWFAALIWAVSIETEIDARAE